MFKNPIIDYENGSYINTEPLIQECIEYLKSININALVLSCYFGAPHFSITVSTIQDVFDARKIAKVKGNEIIEEFYHLHKKYGIQEKLPMIVINPDSIISFSSFEYLCIDHLTRRCRKRVLWELNHNGIYPHEVFGRNTDSNYSILPGYYIFFKNPDELKKANEPQRIFIKDICINVLSEEDKSGTFKPEKIEFDFFDAITNNYSMGHLARDAE